MITVQNMSCAVRNAEMNYDDDYEHDEDLDYDPRLCQDPDEWYDEQRDFEDRGF